MFDGRPSALGADSLTPAPCTSTITTMARALTTRSNEMKLKSGRAGSGIARGMAPWSSTRATLSAPAITTASVGMINATSALTMFRPGSGQPEQDGQRREPGQQRRQVDAARMGDHVQRLRQGVRALSGDAGQVAELAADDVDRDPGEEPSHHRVRHEPGVAAQPEETGRDHGDSGEHREQEQRCWPLIGIEPNYR